jgi:hypothetical protein
MKVRMFVTMVALVALSGALAYAQTATAEIGFPFVAGGKDFAAGKYSFELQSTGTGAVILLRGAAGTKELLSLTTLGRHDRDQEFEVVFDKVGGKFLLSEVWFPEKDGYLLLSTKEAHEHAVVGGSNPRK